MAFKVSLLFQLTTSPVNQGQANAHSAGWSEGFWRLTDVDLTAKVRVLANLRAAFLPAQASIVGFRVQNYGISGLKLVPGPSNSVKERFAGNAAFTCDVPQMALRMVLPTANGLNKATFNMRGIADNQIEQGEANLTAAYYNHIHAFARALNVDQWAVVGRNLANPTNNIVSIVGGAVKFAVPIAGVVVNQTYLQIIRCIDENGVAVTGTYLVTNIDANTNTYTLQGLNANAGASGTVRVAALTTALIGDFGQFVTYRAVVRKVGRPFESYRGRGSRKK